MSDLAIVAVFAFSIWLAALTVALLIVIRQLSLLSLRFQLAGPRFSPAEDGLDVGRAVPSELLASIPEASSSVAYVIVASAICAPCREIAPGLARLRLDEPVVALVAGRAELADALASSFPAWIRILRDPVATQFANLLQVKSTPFAMELENGQVTGKVFLHEATDLMRLVNARRSGQRRLPRMAGEAVSHAR